MISRFSIYHAPDAPPSVKTAAEELQTHLRLAIGTELPIVTNPCSPMICLGDNEAARRAGLSSADLPWEGSRTVTRGDDVYIVGRDLPDDGPTPRGGDSLGTLFGVYEFLERVVGVRWLMSGEHGTSVPECPGLRLGQLDYASAPGLAWRQLSNAGDRDWYRRQRFSRRNHGGSDETSYNHVWDKMFPSSPGHVRWAKRIGVDLETGPELYETTPEIFEMNSEGKRVCPHGRYFSVCLSYPKLNQTVADRAVKIIDATSSGKTGFSAISLSPNDAKPTCFCPACQEKLTDPDPRYYFPQAPGWGKSWTLPVMDYYRKTTELITARRPNAVVGGLIYQKYGLPHPDVKPLPPNFAGVIAPSELAYGPSRLHPKVNECWERLIAAWSPKLSRKYYYGLEFWLRQFSGAPQPPYMEVMRSTFAAFRRHGFDGAYFYGNRGWGQSALVNYMLARMLWDPSRDPRQVFDEFMDRAYGRGAADVAKLYLAIDDSMTRFVLQNIQQRIGYDMYPEMLRDVYGSVWPEIQSLYLAAEEKITDPAARWRLEQLGKNLKVLHYELTRQKLIPMDESSPFYLDERDYMAFSKANRCQQNVRNANLNQRMTAAMYRSSHYGRALIKASVKAAPPISGAPTAGQYFLRYHQEIIIRPVKDGPIRVELGWTSIDELFETEPKEDQAGEKRLPDTVYYNVYDLDLNHLHYGIARDSRFIEFPGKKGEAQWLILSPLGNKGGKPVCSFKCDAPYALGDRIGAQGIFIYKCESPLYFHVPEGVGQFKLFFIGLKKDVSILDPNGDRVDGFKDSEYYIAKLDATDRPPGFWRIVFDGTYSGKIRQDDQLSGFFTVDARNPLIITQEK